MKYERAKAGSLGRYGDLWPTRGKLCTVSWRRWLVVVVVVVTGPSMKGSEEVWTGRVRLRTDSG
jgi:hypothetical protein